MDGNPFTDGEISRRLIAVRTALAGQELDAAVFASPENVFYLTGLDHWGYFAPHLLVVPLEGKPMLVTRAMERVTIENHVRAADFHGHSDSETAADLASRIIAGRGLAGKRLGLEYWTSGLSYGLAQQLTTLASANWQDVSGMVDRLRLVKSPEEQSLMRQAAAITDVAAAAAIEAIADGADERDVAAECIAAMTRAGGHVPGFGPFIRPASRLGEEHTTWGGEKYRNGEPVFIELSGCISRYHAPLGRLIRLGVISDADARMAEVAAKAFNAVLGAMKHGARARDVYGAWQGVVDDAGLSRYRRHHCGYCVGIGQPPSWTGGNTVTGLRPDSDLEIRTGMSFHILSRP